MQLYKKILVAIDCSSVDNKIIEHVSLLAQQNSAHVYLLHVVHSHTIDQNRALHQKCESMMESYTQTLQEHGVEVTIIMKTGEPEEEILTEIEQNEYDLVAMATHGHGFLGDILFGSVSDSLKHKINVPLLLIRAKD